MELNKKWIIIIAVVVIGLVGVMIATNGEASDAFKSGMEAGMEAGGN